MNTLKEYREEEGYLFHECGCDIIEKTNTLFYRSNGFGREFIGCPEHCQELFDRLSQPLKETLIISGVSQ